MISRLERRQSPENPSTSLSNPASWFMDWATGGGSTKSGVEVNNATALNLSAVYAAIRRISDDVAKLPLRVFERLETGRDPATEHHLYHVLKDRPNPVMSSYTFWEVFMGHVLSWGNGYAEIERDGSGRVIALWPLRPDRMKVQLVRERKAYVYQAEDGQRIPFTQDEVFHIPGFGYDGLVGYNPIRIARESLGLTTAMERYGAAFFGNGSRASGVLESPETLSDEAFERLRKSWEQMHKGVDNAHRVAILEGGVGWQQIGIPPEEGQFLEGRQFQTREVARWFQIAPQKIGDLEDSHFNNAEHFDQAHLNDTIQPWVERIERQINWELFPESQRGQFFARFQIQALLRPDSEARANFYQTLFNLGAFSPNDILELEERNPVEGGDQRFVPLNMIPLSRASDPIGSGDDGPEDDDFRGVKADAKGDAAEFFDRLEKEVRRRKQLLARNAAHESPAPKDKTLSLKTRNRYGEEATIPLTVGQSRSVAMRQRLVEANRPLFEDTAQRVLNRELIQARRALSRSFGARDQREFRVWVDEFYDDHGAFVTEQFLPALLAYASEVYAAASDEVGADTEMTPEARRFVQVYAETFGERWSGSSRNQLLALMRDTPPEEMEAVLAERFDEWEEKRAGKVATRETVRASGATSKFAYAAAGITLIRWVAIGESCPFCDRMNGRTSAIQSAFLREGDSVEPEHGDKDALPINQTIGHPPLHRGCDCHLVAETGE